MLYVTCMYEFAGRGTGFGNYLTENLIIEDARLIGFNGIQLNIDARQNGIDLSFFATIVRIVCK